MAEAPRVPNPDIHSSQPADVAGYNAALAAIDTLVSPPDPKNVQPSGGLSFASFMRGAADALILPFGRTPAQEMGNGPVEIPGRSSLPSIGGSPSDSVESIITSTLHDSEYEAALAAYRRDDYKQAVEMYKRLEAKFSGDFWFRHDEAVALTATCEAENVRKAIDLLESCRDENPRQTWVLSSLAIAYGRAGRYTECLRAYQDALKADPSNSEAKIIQGDGENTKKEVIRDELQERGRQELLQNKNPIQALRFYEAALAVGGEQKLPWSVFDKGVALEAIGAYQEALSTLQRSRQFMPESAWPDVEIGKLYETIGKRDEAREAYRSALKKSPANNEASDGLQRVGNVNELGLLEWEEYEKRRSDTLIHNPQAELSERQEVEKYISRMPVAYREELSKMNATIGRKMDRSCRVAIVIPAYQEGRIITRTLSQFLSQKDRGGIPIDPSLFEIIIVDNHPESTSKDNTEDEVQKFQQEHPEMRFAYTHKVWEKGEAGVGNARRHGADLALLRFTEQEKNTADLIIVSSDADLYGISDTYISEIIKRFDENKMLDGLSGGWTLPEKYLTNPNLRACHRLQYLIDRVLQRNFIPGQKRVPNFPKMQGLNSAFRASILAGIGGYNKDAKLAEDLEIGWMIRAARKDIHTQDYAETPMKVTTDPRRFLVSLAQGVPFVKMYDGFHESPEIRQSNNDEILGKIPSEFDPNILEQHADALWQARSGPYKWYDNFFELYDRTLKKMGIDYIIEDRRDADGMIRSHIKITDTKRLKRYLEGAKREG